MRARSVVSSEEHRMSGPPLERDGRPGNRKEDFMMRLTLTVAALAVLVSAAQAGALNTAKNQSKNTTQQGNQEQPGPFGFPGHKTLCERLMATPEQDAAI